MTCWCGFSVDELQHQHQQHPHLTFHRYPTKKYGNMNTPMLRSVANFMDACGKMNEVIANLSNDAVLQHPTTSITSCRISNESVWLGVLCMSDGRKRSEGKGEVNSMKLAHPPTERNRNSQKLMAVVGKISEYDGSTWRELTASYTSRGTSTFISNSYPASSTAVLSLNDRKKAVVS